ncbi:hypothetical protein AB0D08_02485 [Kitasatospora sp. NPDC048540]|uniref:three-helix bundle dimerization domain-containing protein n=1 Tax=unclassified Kitasatospora TaxID=2633591 RepID=UPI00053A0245|nr:hypothetical protein [Kitasatospora sp. MBT63]
MTAQQPAAARPSLPGDGGAAGPAEAAGATPEERDAVQLVATRLKRAHPTADPSRVDAVVATAYGELSDARVRTFIPILVERRALTLLTTPPPAL